MNVLKQLTGLVASMGVNEVVGNAIKATTPQDLNKYKKGLVFIGTMVIGGIAGGAANKYVEQQFDEFQNIIDKVKEGGEDESE